MGNEFAQLREWDENREQDWMILAYPNHDAFRHFRAALNEAYLQNEAFWSREYDPAAFRWVDCEHGEWNLCAILRQGRESAVLAVFNFGDTPQAHYKLDLPAGKLTLLLDTDWQCWGGSTEMPHRRSSVTVKEGKPFRVTMPPYSGKLYRLTPAE